MDETLNLFLSLPTPLIAALLGGIGGALGVMFGYLISKAMHSKKAVQLAPIIFAVLFVTVPMSWIDNIKKREVESDKFIRELRGIRIYKILFDLDPKAEEDFRRNYIFIFSDNKKEDKFFKSVQSLTAQLVQKYFYKHIVSASDNSVYNFLVRNKTVMQRFKNKPEFCVGYYLGNNILSREFIKENEKFVEEEGEIKALVLESVMQNPSPIKNPAKLEDLSKIIANDYIKNGYNLNNLEKIGLISSIPPNEGCRIGIEFVQVIVSLGPKQSSYVFKSMVLNK